LRDIHRDQIFHRDIKSLNVFITEEKQLKIGDFGISQIYDPQVKGEICGTLQYMAPEIIDSKPFGFESDVWSLGCVFYELCSKKKPFNESGGQLAIMA